MNGCLTPQRWANNISQLLNAVLGSDRFPVKVEEVAKEFSRVKFPDDPLSIVAGDILPGFDGALYRAPSGKKGWGIIYNNSIRSKGRINFTLAHEFGHYLQHRIEYPNGIQCGQQDLVRWDSTYGQIEHQANVFAATLLMPLDDYRKQIDSRSKVDLRVIGHCASRYDVSLIAAILRWLEFTEQRAVLVVSRDGFILWSRASKNALNTGIFIRAANLALEIPPASLAAKQVDDTNIGIQHDAGVWFREPCHELCVFSEQYDFTLSLLQLEREPLVLEYNETL